ncbi:MULTISPECIES: LPS translocon maturation chaperone LptM [Grimontia]|uniref:LPS translocon maturation chaperone LptM n=1 Tax=Grimontia TaxID=246861 RepID=UPI0009FBADFB|nr:MULTISPECIES: lipoprotein [Grimontia]WRV96623.1 lipoprotein [Grimontia sp. NTOU-MAR1]
MMRLALKLAALATVALISACGQQGPLYFPEDIPAQNEQVNPETPQDTQESTQP